MCFLRRYLPLLIVGRGQANFVPTTYSTGRTVPCLSRVETLHTNVTEAPFGMHALPSTASSNLPTCTRWLRVSRTGSLRSLAAVARCRPATATAHRHLLSPVAPCCGAPCESLQCAARRVAHPSHRSAGSEGPGLEPWPTCFETDTPGPAATSGFQTNPRPAASPARGLVPRAHALARCRRDRLATREHLVHPASSGAEGLTLSCPLHKSSDPPAQSLSCPALPRGITRTSPAGLASVAMPGFPFPALPLWQNAAIFLGNVFFVKTSRCLRAGPAWMGATRCKNQLIVLRCLFFPLRIGHRLLGVQAVRLRLNTHKRTQAQSPITTTTSTRTRARCRLSRLAYLGNLGSRAPRELGDARSSPLRCTSGS